VPNRWVLGARLRTLPAAVVPVAVGCGVAGGDGAFCAGRAALALVAALGLQVGTNYANDYSDGKRGTDDPSTRTGPIRLVGSRLATPSAVRRAAMAAFAVAGVAGASLAIAVDLRLLVVGVASFAAGWLYTGGPKPYGYIGLGEVFVFVFFGLVATVGSAYVHLERIEPLAVSAAVPIGLWAVALLVVNNLRDRIGDAASGKRTMAVRLGDRATRGLFSACLILGAVVALTITPLAVAAVALIAGPIQRVRRGAAGRDLIAVLGQTSLVQLVGGIAMAVGIATHVGLG
jgi:1,4-dihydroxy-2-naphthoate octaprenyltransferase